MKTLYFSLRTAKEIVRDPLNLFFGLGFPVILLLLLSAIQANIPVSLFEIQSLAPGITVFGLAFMSLFTASLLARDRETAFLQRLYTTPLSAFHFVLGYALPILPIAVGQTAVCYLVAFALGLPFTVNVFLALLGILPISLFFICFGILCGSVLNSKQVGGICGALLTNLTAWLSGIWFDIKLVGGVFEEIANILPFLHAVELERSLLNGNFSSVSQDIFWVLGYMLLIGVIAVLLFLRQMKKE